MKANLLERYERDAQGEFVIDVAAQRAEDLYNDFDKSAPYVRRDLDQDLVEYLSDCAGELHHQPFFIRFTLARFPEADRQSRVRASVHNFFVYLAETQRQHRRESVRRSLIYGCVGVVILFLSIWINKSLRAEYTVVRDVLAQGLTIAGWISMWEAFTTFLIHWSPYRKSMRIYAALARARIVFRTDPGAPKLP